MPSNPAFSVYALAAVLVCSHMLLLDAYSGVARARSKTTPNPEDSKTFEIVATEPEAVARVLRAHRNLVANGVPFLLLGLVMVLQGTTKTAAMAYFGTFIVARLGHTFAYLSGKQPFRSLFFAVGQLAITGMAVQIVRTALAGL
jgi:uncharacterized MAPEG superfamily protein